MKKLICLLAPLLFSTISNAELVIKNAIVPEAPPVAKVLTAYMELHNKTDKAQAITRFSSPQFKRIEMHRTEIVDDIATMKAIQDIRIAAGGTAHLKSGGMHLMMFNPKARYKDGDCIELTLHFENGEAQSIRVSVEKRSGTIDHSHHH